jgi:hypothetical protein
MGLTSIAAIAPGQRVDKQHNQSKWRTHEYNPDNRPSL